MKLSIKFRVLLLSFCMLFTHNVSAAPQVLNGVAAIVNSNIITIAQLKQRVAAIKQQLQEQQIKLPAESVIETQVMQMMIGQELQTQTAQRMNITATDADVREFIQHIAEQQKVTPEQLREELAKQGIPETQFLNDIRQQVINQKILRDVIAPQVTVTPQEIASGVKMAETQGNVNTQYHLLHIIIPLPDSPTPEQIAAAQSKADGIMNQIQQGMDFKMLAAAESSGDQTFSGGDLGWKSLTELPTIFADNVSKMKVDQVAGPLQAANGFHIIKLVGVRQGKAGKVDTALQQQVANMIFQRKLQERQESWLEELRAGAYVKILYNPDNLPSPV